MNRKNNINKQVVNKQVVNKQVVNKQVVNKKNIKIDLININNINTFINSIKITNVTEAIIFGKGPTFKTIEKKENYFFICVNQSINFVDNCDMLVINDLHNIYLINDDKIKVLKYLLIPEYLHIHQSFNISGHYTNIIEYLTNKNFTGKYIVYNLKTNPNSNKELISLYTAISSGNNATDFVCMFMNSFIKNISYYGIGKFNENNNYYNLFTGNGKYTVDNINKITSAIELMCNKYKINYILN